MFSLHSYQLLGNTKDKVKLKCWPHYNPGLLRIFKYKLILFILVSVLGNTVLGKPQYWENHRILVGMSDLLPEHLGSGEKSIMGGSECHAPHH